MITKLVLFSFLVMHFSIIYLSHPTAILLTFSIFDESRCVSQICFVKSELKKKRNFSQRRVRHTIFIKNWFIKESLNFCYTSNIKQQRKYKTLSVHIELGTHRNKVDNKHLSVKIIKYNS